MISATRAIRQTPPTPRRRAERRKTSLFAHGEPQLWCTAGALVLCLVMIAALLGLIAFEGVATFWQQPLTGFSTVRGAVLGEVVADETYRPAADAYQYMPPNLRAFAEASVAAAGGTARRRLVRVENFELSGEHHRWVSDFETRAESRPMDAVAVERRESGRLYGFPVRLERDGVAVARGFDEVWPAFERAHDACLKTWDDEHRLRDRVLGDLDAELEKDRLAVRAAELKDGAGSPAHQARERAAAATAARVAAETSVVTAEIAALTARSNALKIVFATAGGEEKALRVADVIRAVPANRLGWGGRVGVWFARWGEFLTAEPRERNNEGGVLPAIFGTVVMTLLMSLAVVPFGVLAALYLREYAKAGVIVSVVRIAVNNLAGVPSIVFGVFGVGFLCYAVGGSIDHAFHAEKLPSPTFGTGGVLWASLTLALMTLPVVIVATEEALAAVPRSMREGSYACGASQWQTIRRIVLPRAMPGIMTGMILAMARGAGEVAPLMLVGAVDAAPRLPVDATFPFVHLERSFMHLGFHIFDLGFRSPNSEAAKPMVFTTTLLLIAIVVLLNLTAVSVRTRLRRRFMVGQF